MKLTRVSAGAVVLAAAFSRILAGQTDPARPTFDVASVKVNTTNESPDLVPRRSGNRIVMRNVRLDMLVSYAYGGENGVYNIAGNLTLPGSPDNSWFDIEAIAPGTPADDELRRMFQALLEDRFRLSTHRETRELLAYDLVPGKNGPVIMAASEDNRFELLGKFLGTEHSYVLRSDDGCHLIGRNATLEQLIATLALELKAPVRDRTGLTGMFDYNVLFSRYDKRLDVDAPPDLITAIQQLGLKLEGSKRPVEVIVVDHLEKPSAN
jgi:uncharacterized protein (TIGR03435 family)